MARWPAIGVFVALLGLGAVACKQEQEAPAPGEIVVDPGLGAIRVEAGRAELGRLEREVTATGMTSPWQSANLRAEAGGRVLSVNVDNGDEVEAGDLLLRIDASRQRLAVSGASSRVTALEQDVELARTDFERKQALVAKGSLPKAQLDAARLNMQRAEAALSGAQADLGSARRSSRDARVSAPIGGIVARKLVDLGDVVGPGAPLMDLVDLSRIRVRVGLAGNEIGRLDQQAEAKIRVEDLGGEAVPASFAAIAPSADPITGLFDVEYHVDNADRQIRGGMVATVELPLNRAPERVLAPRASLTRRDGRLAVFVLEDPEGGEGQGAPEGFERRIARLRPVRAGAYGDASVEILGGLEPGELVATTAQHVLADGVLVEFARSPALAGPVAQAAPAPADAETEAATETETGDGAEDAEE